MYSLEEIVERNNRAAQQGWIAPNTAVGTHGVKPTTYHLLDEAGHVIASGTKAQLVQRADYQPDLHGLVPA